MTKEMKKAEVFNVFVAPIFCGAMCSQTSLKKAHGSDCLRGLKLNLY